MNNRFGAQFNKWVDRRIYHEGDGEQILLVKRIWWVCLMFAVLVTMLLTVLFYYLHQRELALFFFLGALYWLFSLILFNHIKRGIEWFGLSSQLFLILFSFVMAWLMGGILESGGIIFIGLIAPVYAIVFPNRRRAIFVLVLYLTSLLILLGFDPFMVPRYPLQEVHNLYLFILFFIVSAVFWFIAIYFFSFERSKALTDLHHEQIKSRNLLLNILPGKVVDVLKDSGPKVIADQLEDVTILFADLVGFTSSVTAMAPKEIIVFLNEIFTVMDELSEKYKMEKIKTIGDCYMAVAGAPEPVKNHASAAARMALDIHKYAESHQLQFRIGINTGPVVAGIIGFKKFSYDLWGDSVNIASRLESEAGPGTTQISSRTYGLIKDEFECTPLGIKDLKGIGKTSVWQLKGLSKR